MSAQETTRILGPADGSAAAPATVLVGKLNQRVKFRVEKAVEPTAMKSSTNSGTYSNNSFNPKLPNESTIGKNHDQYLIFYIGNVASR